eukprot:g8722.t1
MGLPRACLLLIAGTFLCQSACGVDKLDVEWKDVSLSLGNGKKAILHGVSGKAKAGRLLAVMGPSGSGKTTLLNALAGQIPYSKKARLHGTLWVGGAERDSGQEQAYVKQEDVFYSQLTVRETLLMAARLRLPRSMSLEDKTAMVDELISKLGLSKVADTIVGDEKTRGISGGERKRLSIACQLFGTPSLIFCDEPTTGLDSFQAERVMDTLRQLARDGHTVICSIHQPRSSIFRMFDDVMLLSEGRVMFQGPAGRVGRYFRSRGHAMPPNTNPGDFAVDVVSVDYTSKETEEESKARIARFDADHRASPYSSSSSVLGTLIRSAGLVSGGATITSGGDAAAITRSPGEGKAGPLEQFRLLLARSWRQVNRAKFANATRVIANLGSAVVFGSIFWKLGMGQSHINDRIGLLQTSVIQTAMSTVAKTLVTFPKEATIVKAERSLNMYSVLPYFLSKMIAELPLTALFPSISGVVMYKMTDLHPKRDRLAKFLGILTLEAFTAAAFGMLVGCIAKDGDAALAIGPPLMTIFILFSGFYITQDNVPRCLWWLKDASMIKQAFEALCVNELQGLEFDCDTKSRGPCIKTGQQMLDRVAFGESTVEGATLGLTKILGGCWALTYLALVVGNPKFQPMLDPSLLAVRDTPGSAIAVSGGGSGGGGSKNGGFHHPKTGAGVDGAVASGVSAGSTGTVVGTENLDMTLAAAPAVIAGSGSAAAAAAGGRRGFGVFRIVRRWTERRGRHRDSRRRHRRARVCGDELEHPGGSARVAAPVLVRAGK